jgi:hypothetical protein
MPYNVLKDGVINEEEQDYEDYNSDGTELVYSSDEEKPRCKRTTGFLVFASENKKDKTDRTIMNLGSPSSKVDLDLMTQLGERWKDLSEEEHTNYALKAEIINNHYAEIMDVELD